jgi:hypothetical protein
MKTDATRTQQPVPLLAGLSGRQLECWQGANREIIWGWKRDVNSQNRIVYFSGNMSLDGADVHLSRFFFFLRAKVHRRGSDAFVDAMKAARARFAGRGDAATLDVVRQNGHLVAELAIGQPDEKDFDRTRRLKLRRPRKTIVEPVLPEPIERIDPDTMLPADLYVGSGVSYEAGLPTLCDMHDIFGVDSHTANGFMVGSQDWLPRALAEEGTARLEKFSTVHTKAILVEPTEAMRTIADLARRGAVRAIFTDNVDNLLSKTGARFERVRGSGVFNERHEVEFASPNLIVIGVAADRRQIIRQARAAGVHVHVVNPCAKVSPNVTHLDYVRPDDIFFKMEARKFFGNLGA